MIVGVGVDAVAVGRMEQAIVRHGERFLARVFTQGERRDCERRTQSYAARFAAKEAAIKALGGVVGAKWHDLEVVKGDSGKPELMLHGRARAVADERKVARFHLSITHESTLAIALVIAESA